MKNIHVLLTDKPSRLYRVLEGYLRFEKEETNYKYTQNQNIYITSDEEIKEGDYTITLPIKEWTKPIKRVVENSYNLTINDKKIILTTDQELIKDGVQAIPDEFLEWFVKNPSCEWVDVEKTFVTNSGLGYQEYAVLDSNFKVIEINAKTPQTSYYLGKITILSTYEYVINYKIIIPQEESKQREIFLMNANTVIDTRKPKQETLEEAAEKEFPLVDTQWCRTGAAEEENLQLLGARKSFIKGAKWQAERMYSEEEIIAIITHFEDEKPLKLKEWFEQFKKK